MPEAMERKLKKQAKRRNIKDKDAYVYGTMRKTGWKPEREKAPARKRKPAAPRKATMGRRTGGGAVGGVTPKSPFKATRKTRQKRV